MAVLKSIQSGNFTNSASWALVDATSYQGSVGVSTALQTSPTNSVNFNTGNVTAVGMLIHINNINTTSGFLTADLYNVSGATNLARVILNIADLPFSSTQAATGWVYLAFSGAVSLNSTNAYRISVSFTTANVININATTSSANFTRGIVTTTSQAPVDRDILIVNGIFSGNTTASTSSSVVTITMNQPSSATTTYFNGVFVDPKGNLSYSTDSNSNFQLRIAGNLSIRGGGLFEMGNSTTRIPSSSTALLEMSGTGLATSSIIIQNSGKLNADGNLLTYNRAKLALFASANTRSITTNVSTGWKNNDTIIIPSTSRSATPNTTIDIRSLSGDASGTTIYLTGLTSAHDGSVSTLLYADIGNYTRNVKIFGTTATNTFIFSLGGYNPIVDLDSVEIYNVAGGATNTNSGYIISTTMQSGSTSIVNSAIYNLTTFTYVFLLIQASMTSPFHVINISNNVFYGFASVVNDQLSVSVTTYDIYSGNTICDNLFIRCGATTFRINYNFSGNTFTSHTSYGLQLGTLSYGVPLRFVPGGWDNIRLYSTASATQMGYTIPWADFIINNFVAFRNNFSAINVTSWGGLNPSSTIGPARVIFKNGIFFGNNNAGIVFGNMAGPIVMDTCYFYGGFTATQLYGVFNNNSNLSGMEILNCYFGIIPASAGGGSSALTTAILGGGVMNKLYVYNPLFSGGTSIATTLANNALTHDNQGISVMNFNQSKGDNRLYTSTGVLLRDTTIFSGSSPSIRLTPNNALFKCYSSYQRVPVNSGSTCTVSVLVRKSTAADGTNYNGNQPRLILKRNYPAAINSDVLLSSGVVANGVWEVLTGTTPIVDDDCVLEFYVDCDGTTGWINVDTWRSTTTNDTRDMKYWIDGQPYVEIDYVSGGTTTITTGSGGSWTFVG